jgi:hypothetical protein
MKKEQERLKKCCDQMVTAITRMKEDVKTGIYGDGRELRRRLERLKTCVFQMHADEEEYRVITSTLISIMESVSDDSRFMEICMNEMIFAEMAGFLRGSRISFERGRLSNSVLKKFIDEMRICTVSTKLCIACQLGTLISEKARDEIAADFHANIDSLSSMCIYYGVSNGVVLYDQDIEDRLYDQIMSADCRKDSRAVLFNPVYVLIKLYNQHFFYSVCKFEKILKNNNLFQFAIYPQLFDYDLFDPQWVVMLTIYNYIIVLKKRGAWQVIASLKTIRGSRRPMAHRIIRNMNEELKDDPDESTVELECFR